MGIFSSMRKMSVEGAFNLPDKPVSPMVVPAGRAVQARVNELMPPRAVRISLVPSPEADLLEPVDYTLNIVRRYNPKRRLAPF